MNARESQIQAVYAQYQRHIENPPQRADYPTFEAYEDKAIGWCGIAIALRQGLFQLGYVWLREDIKP